MGGEGGLFFLSFWAFVQCMAPPLFSSYSSFPSPNFMSCSKACGNLWWGDVFFPQVLVRYGAHRKYWGEGFHHFFSEKNKCKITNYSPYVWTDVPVPLPEAKTVEIEEKKTYIPGKPPRKKSSRVFSLLFFFFLGQSVGPIFISFISPLKKGRDLLLTLLSQQEKTDFFGILSSFHFSPPPLARIVTSSTKKNQISPKCFHFHLSSNFFPHSPSPLNIREFFHPFKFFSFGKIPF